MPAGAGGNFFSSLVRERVGPAQWKESHVDPSRPATYATGSSIVPPVSRCRHVSYLINTKEGFGLQHPPSLLFGGYEHDVHGCGNLRDLPRRGERPRGLVNAEDHDVV